jgi:hypothetical protein
VTVGRDSVRTASPRHCLLVRRHLKTGELAFYCVVTAALLKDRTDTQVPPGRESPPDPRKIPLTDAEIRRLLAAAPQRQHPPGHTAQPTLAVSDVRRSQRMNT